MICAGALPMRLQEQIDEQRLDRRRVVADLVIARRLRPAQLQPVQRALAGQRRAVRAPRRQLAGQHRHHRIVAQLVVIVQVLVAQRDAEHPLRRPACRPRARSAPACARSREARGKPSISPIARSVAPSSSAPASEVIAPPSNAATTARPSTGANSNSIRATLCRHRGTPLLQQKSLSQKNFRRFGAPMHLLMCEICGLSGTGRVTVQTGRWAVWAVFAARVPLFRRQPSRLPAWPDAGSVGGLLHQTV